jgi:ATP-dependent exoDNAse (exonuclease V) alpha subunit
MSMTGHKMLSWLDNRLRAGTGKEDIPFDGMPVILMGDFGQLPPVGDRPMYVSGNGTVVSDHGHSLYLIFESVIILDQVMRQAGEDPEAVAFRALRMRIRNGKVTEEDWRLLLDHSTTNIPMDQFTDAIRLYFDNKSVTEYNYEKLLQLRQHVAKIQAKHSGHGASVATSDEAGRLDTVLFLSTNAEVMLTCNLWAEVRLCNGSFGTIEQIWFAENLGPPNLPVAILVHFHSYSGPEFLDSCSKCMPVPPKVFEWMADGKYLSRQQVPLQLRYAMAIHKSQGQTLTKAVVDLGEGEKIAGCTFVAASWVRSIHDIVFEPMTFDRLKSIVGVKVCKKD